MTYQEAIDYLYSQLPMFQRIGAAAYKADLNNTIFLCESLNNPQLKFKSIHIAGTNGKGSVSHFTASILQSAGLKVGLYTSPHLRDFRERIKINGKMIPREKVVNFIKNNKDKFNSIKPSFFEYTFGMAVRYFAEENVDIAVMETGMGGRLDSTNVIDSIVSVITNIGLDHTQFLGNTLQQIAVEKAGIIKVGVPVIIGETQKETTSVFLEKAKQQKTELYFADQNFGVNSNKYIINPQPGLEVEIYKSGKPYLQNLYCNTGGNYQLKNIITSLQLIELLNSLGYKIKIQDIRNGFKKIISQTGFSGRWQILNQKPLTICDTAHNTDGIKEVISQLKSLKYNSLHFVLGMVNDKNIESVIALLPRKAIYYFCRANIPRGLNQAELKTIAQQHKLTGEAYPSVISAYQQAQSIAKRNDLIFIGGSTFVVAEVL